MKYCVKCGNELADDAVICPKCGCATELYNASESKENNDKALKKIALIFMIISTVGGGLALIPLIWMLPMTLSYSKKIKNEESVSMGFKVCTLLFVNMIPGILMLCAKD